MNGTIYPTALRKQQQLRSLSAYTGTTKWALWHPLEMDEETSPLESASELQHRHQGPMRTADDHHTSKVQVSKASSPLAAKPGGPV